MGTKVKKTQIFTAHRHAMPPDTRIRILMQPHQITNLRSILQKIERYERVQRLLGITYEELRAATDALERLPLLSPKH